MNTILKFYIELFVASILSAILGLMMLVRLDFIKPDGVVFVGISSLLPIVILGYRNGLRGAVPCALMGGALFYYIRYGSVMDYAALTELILAPLFASLAGLFKTYSRPSYLRVMLGGVFAEAMRLIFLSIGGHFSYPEPGISTLISSFIDNFYFVAADTLVLLAILSALYFSTKGRLFEYKI